MASVESVVAEVVHHAQLEVDKAVAVIKAQAAADKAVLMAQIARNRSILAADLRMAVAAGKEDIVAVRDAVEAALKAHDL